MSAPVIVSPLPRHHKRLSEYDKEDVAYLWPQRIARGKFHIIAGDPGDGKTFITCDMAARKSAGKPWPDGSPCEAGDVIIWNAEDAPGDTLRPRIEAMGGNLDRIHILDTDMQVSLDGNLGVLKDIQKETNAELSIIDPVAAFLGHTDSFKDAEVRRTLSPVTRFAIESRLAVVAVMHLNKAEDFKLLYRVGGSIGFVGAARIAHICVPDPRDPDKRLFGPLKFNIGPRPPTLGYYIGADNCVGWDLDPGMDVKDAVSMDEEKMRRDATKLAEAKQYLRDLLKGGALVMAEKGEKEARRKGISERTLDRARRALGVEASRLESVDGRPWTWRLDEDDSGVERHGLGGVHYSQ